MTPGGLNPGDQFRIIFVSSDFRDATSPTIADYDSFIANLANAAGLTYNGATVQWFALGSTIVVSAISRLPASPSSPGLYLVSGAKVADNTSDLWDGSLLRPINLQENGIPANPSITIVWTGTNSNGSASSPNELGQGRTTSGDFTATASGWVQGPGFGSGGPQRLYGYSEALTVPQSGVVPEPATVTLMLVGIASWAGSALARRRRGALPPSR